MTPGQSNGNDRVLVAGAGPVGSIAALALARRGIPVTVLEAEAELQQDPRAATTHPATLEMLDDIGLAKDVEEQGLVAVEFHFRDRPTGELVAVFDHTLLADDTRFPYVVQCEQYKTAALALAALEALPDGEVRFSHRLTGIRQTGDEVVATVETPGGEERLSGRYLIGADGGRSTVRKEIEIPFEGFTYPERFLVLTTPFDFAAQRGYVYRNYFADPDEWCNLFKVSADGPPGLWRTVFPTDPKDTDEEVLSDERVQARLGKFFPKGDAYAVIHRNLYKIHQRVVARYREGRVLLAGDAAHLNNPIGGLGMNCGIHDAINLAEKLARVWFGEAEEDELDRYDAQRRTTAIDYLQAQTIRNKKRLEEKDPEIRRRNLAELSETAADPERARQFLLATSMIASVRRAATLG
jgi:3-(3-hydroxy-phenyl)propionate hydroxylase